LSSFQDTRQAFGYVQCTRTPCKRLSHIRAHIHAHTHTRTHTHTHTPHTHTHTHTHTQVRKMNTQFDNSHNTTFITLDDVIVPVANLIGEENAGFGYVLINFNHERFVR
jgi:hypothetical protein